MTALHNRRLLILLSFTCAMSLVLFFLYDVARPVAAVTLSDRVVITTSDGVAHTFLKSEAVDKGSFNSPAGFIQRNLCDTDSSMPHMTVCFRPDTDTSRDEVVFEYGTFMQSPKNTGAYTATFYAGSTQLAQKSVSNQYFYQRWRWIPQGYRSRYRTIASLEAAKLLPPYRKGIDPQEQNDNIASAPSGCLYINVFDTACLTQYMGSTGERDDLGHVTGWQGNYLLSGSEAWWQVVLSQAEAGMGIPWNIRDEGGTPINFFRTTGIIVNRQQLTTHSNSWGQSFNLDRHTDNNTGWSLDQSHQPALFYLPWLLTGDPYYLEGMQFANSSNTLYTNWDRRSNNLADLMEEQVRGKAWNLRTLVGLVASTPDTVPGWLLPRSYYQRQSLENSQKALDQSINSTDSLQTVLSAWSTGFWQHDFMTFETGWATWLGLSEWKPIYEFGIKNELARVNGTSGWERRCPTVYYIPDGVYTSWSQAWQLESTTNNRVPPSNGLLCNVDAYTSYLLGSLAMATYIGIPGADTYYLWLHDMVAKTVDAGGGGTLGAKWAVAPAYVVNNLPLPTPSTSPAPVLTLSAIPSSITAGQSSTLTWVAAGATSCSGTGFSASGTSGSVSVAPSQTTTYILACSGSGGSSTQSVTVSVSGTLTPAPTSNVIPKNSFLGTYFDNKDLTGSSVTRTDPAINFDWSTNAPISGIGADTFSVRWEGDWDLTGGAYTFSVTADDGIRVWVDNQLLLDKWMDQPSAVYTFTRDLTQGTHRLKVEYYDNAVYGVAKISWALTTPTPTPAPTPTPTAGLTISSVSVTGDFQQVSSCPSTLAQGASCTLAVTFTPTSAGTRTGTLTVNHNQSGSPLVVALNGVGEALVLPGASTPASSTSPAAIIQPFFPAAPDTLIGTEGNDMLMADESIKKVDGLGGVDTVKLKWSNTYTDQSWFTIVKNSDGTITATDVHASGNTIRLYRVQKLIFPNGSEKSLLTVSVSDQSLLSPFYSLYQELLNLTSSLTSRVLSLIGARSQLAQVSGSATLSASPTSLTFGSQTVGTQSAPQTITLTYSSAGVSTPTPAPTPTSSGSLSADIKANNSDGPLTVNQGSTLTLSWTSGGATSCVVNPNIAGGISGAQQVTASTNTTYTLSCTNGSTDTSDSVTVNVQSTTPAATQYLTKTLWYRMRDSQVTILQRFLMRENYLAPGNDSGFYGTLTRRAVYNFKCKENISCTSLSRSGSIVGSETRALINQRLQDNPL